MAVNGHYKAVSESFKNNGKTELELGGDAPAGELGLMTINSSAELFLSAMIFDGVFDRHPNLKGISMEHGAFGYLHGLRPWTILHLFLRGRGNSSNYLLR